MPLLHVLILALVQGVTEFLPISSSGHLILTWQILDGAGVEGVPNGEAQRLILDVAVHLGTLFAVLLYFRRDVAEMIAGALKLMTGQRTQGGTLAIMVVFATLPVVAAGVSFKDEITAFLRDPVVIAWATIGFGLLLYMGDRWGATNLRLVNMNYGRALVIGVAQVLALVPGTSRSGITMTAARFLGFERTEAARFSMLLAIPAILGAATLAGLDLVRLGDLALGLDALLAAVLAFLAALAAIALMMAWLKRATFTPFVIYRVLLGILLLAILYS
ncbi:MAG: undecaprenyl-diphosphate phosphatase [Pseudomonadota bacterium]